MISKFFIERPVVANVLAILMGVIGAVALMRLAVAQYPNVVPPTISVTTRYPSTSARAGVDTVALPLGQQVTAGQLGMTPGPNTQAFQYTLDIAGRFDDVSQFENVVVKTEANGQMVHVRDVGRVELGAQTYSQIFTLNGKPAAGIGIFQTLEAHALDVAGARALTQYPHVHKRSPRRVSFTRLSTPAIT